MPPPPPHLIVSPNKRMPVHAVCVVGECKDNVLLGLLQGHFQATLYFSATGKEYLDRIDEIVFLLQDFSGPIFTALKETKGSRVISFTLVRARYSKHLELIAPRLSRPQYCEILKDCVFVFDTNVPNKPDYVNYAHYLGASARKEMIDRATHLVSTSVMGKHFRMAFSMGTKIVRPEFITHFWNKRDEQEITSDDPAIYAQYKLGPFEGLKIAFIGFSHSETAEMSSLVVEKKGEVVVDERQATHVVFNTKALDIPKLEVVEGQKHIGVEWFWQSITLDGCHCEDTFMIKQPTSKRTSRGGVFSPIAPVVSRQSRSGSALLDTSNSSLLSSGDGMYSMDDPEKLAACSPKRVDKRHQVCMEMYETEQSYLRALGLVVKFRNALESDIRNNGGDMMTIEEIQLCFNKFNPIICVHEKICNQLMQLVEKWEPENKIGDVWTEAECQLEKVYPPFINSFETVKSTLENADTSNPRFHAFLKAQEASPDFKRNTMKDLIIRPVQRLPSVLLLLKEIDKRTDSKSPDKEALKRANNVITRVLDKANGTRAKNDEFSNLFRMCSEIDKIPVFLYSSNREFRGELTVTGLGGTGFWKESIMKKQIRMMLFNDILELAKIRADQPMFGGTLSKMRRQFSMTSLNKDMDRRKYKHLKEITLVSIREIFYITTDTIDSQTFIVFTIRGAQEGDEECVFLPPDDRPLQFSLDFIRDVSQLVYSQCGRDVEVYQLPFESASAVIQEIVKKFMKDRFGQSLNSNTSVTMNQSAFLPPPPHPGPTFDRGQNPLLNTTNVQGQGRSGFRRSVSRVFRKILPTSKNDPTMRRALSNASLTLSNKISRFTTSRSQLRSIHEQAESPFMQVLPNDMDAPSGCSSVTSVHSPVDERDLSSSFREPFTPRGRFSSQRMSTTSSLRSLFSRNSRSSIKRRDSTKENAENLPFGQRHSHL